jgi:UDP-N-acetylglucosamine 3-dehydrogenase
MLKAAVIGVGSMGRHHARVYREMESVQLVAVVDPNATQAAKIAGLYGVPYYLDYHQMIDEQQPDLVSLAVPTHLHAPIGLELIAKGIHILIEKPIASTVEEAEALLDMAKKQGVVVAVGHIERFNPVIHELHRRLNDHMLGEIYKVHMQRLSPYPTRIQDAGVIIDLASHDIDLMRYLIDASIVRIYGETIYTIQADREDAFSGLIRFENGIIGVLDVNWITPRKVRSLTITGARGMFCCDLISQELYFYENDIPSNEWDTLKILRGVNEGNVLGIRIQRYEPLAGEITDFVEAVQTGRAPTVTAEDGLETLRLALDFVRSGRENQIVRFTPEAQASS